MKILLVHNYYGSAAPSGENSVYEAEVALLRQHGHQVIEWTRHSDDLRNRGLFGLLKGGVITPWNQAVRQEIRQLIEQERPEIMHVHNTFPLISPAIFHAASGSQTATVLTLHNYRIFCASGILMRDGKPCHLCLEQQSPWMGLYHGCYRNSRLATLPMAVSIAVHRRMDTWNRQLDHLITLTHFQADIMAKAGVKRELIRVKPHFLVKPPQPVPWSLRTGHVVFVGRLSQEKGVHLLLRSWEIWGKSAPELVLIGDGPDRTALENQVKKVGLTDKITFLGQLPHAEAQKRVGQARLLILPSLCYEGFPMVLCEAFALGVPVAASNHGAMTSLIEDGKIGALFKPDCALELESRVRALWRSQKKLATMGKNARTEFEDHYAEKSNYSFLMAIYRSACIRRTKGLKREC
ncbi:MAG: glycosyltransferase family 4 protein [Magnetococcales bacterium]|nr:glycosyltransferase family 4 protein [Magnetococcales bacterium]